VGPPSFKGAGVHSGPRRQGASKQIPRRLHANRSAHGGRAGKGLKIIVSQIIYD